MAGVQCPHCKGIYQPQYHHACPYCGKSLLSDKQIERMKTLTIKIKRGEQDGL